jgi:hypothetical protein
MTTPKKTSKMPKFAPPEEEPTPTLNILKDTLQRSDRDGGRGFRVRLELNPVKARWLLTIIDVELKKMTIDDEMFKDIYDTRYNIVKQLKELKGE